MKLMTPNAIHIVGPNAIGYQIMPYTSLSVSMPNLAFSQTSVRQQPDIYTALCSLVPK